MQIRALKSDGVGVEVARRHHHDDLVDEAVVVTGFGDGQEMYSPELWARIGKAYARFAPSPLASWRAGVRKTSGSCSSSTT